MNHDPSTDPADARLAALYQAHVAQDEQPSAAADARILALAREARARPAIRPVAPGWRAWLHSSWFGPGLAFATIASVSVVVVSLMPKEDMSVERAVAPAPSAAQVVPPVPPAAREVMPPEASTVMTPAAPQVVPPSAPGGLPPVASQSAPAAAAPAPVASAAESATTPAPPVASAKKAAVALASESARAASARSAPGAVVPAAPAVSAAPPAPAGPRSASAGSAAGLAESASARSAAGAVSEARTTPVAPPPSALPAPSVSNALSQRAESEPAPARSLEQPNPFPAQSPVAATGRSDKAAAAAADAGPAQRQEKTSLLSEPTESRLMANQAVPEVRDSAPTYPNEVKSSIPLPYTYTTPHPQPRIAVPGPAGTTGSMAGRPVLPQQYSAATRKETAAEQSAPQAAAASSSTITTAAAPRVRDPAEWIKAIQKLRVEGKSEQVLKELAEFRRQYPAHALPDELKQLK